MDLKDDGNPGHDFRFQYRLHKGKQALKQEIRGMPHARDAREYPDHKLVPAKI